MKYARPQFFGTIAAIALAFVLGWYVGSHGSRGERIASTAIGERKVLYWHDPMVPGSKFDKQGKSPFMDMELVPVYADEAGASPEGAPIVTVRPEIMNSLGVRVAVATPGASGLLIPREALIRTGKRSSVVTALGEGRFQPVDVVAGAELGENIEITKGLKAGDKIVVSGQFLIDSDASTRASFSRMEPPENEKTP
jgi:hypothetical protein